MQQRDKYRTNKPLRKRDWARLLGELPEKLRWTKYVRPSVVKLAENGNWPISVQKALNGADIDRWSFECYVARFNQRLQAKGLNVRLLRVEYIAWDEPACALKMFVVNEQAFRVRKPTKERIAERDWARIFGLKLSGPDLVLLEKLRTCGNEPLEWTGLPTELSVRRDSINRAFTHANPEALIRLRINKRDSEPYVYWLTKVK